MTAGRPGRPVRAALANRIAIQEQRIRILEDRIGQLCSQRVSLEEKLAELYEERRRADRKVNP